MKQKVLDITLPLPLSAQSPLLWTSSSQQYQQVIISLELDLTSGISVLDALWV